MSIEKYPPYTKLWGSETWGNMQVAEPDPRYYPFVDANGDLLLISDPSEPRMRAVFNRISGHLQMSTGPDVFDVMCKKTKPLT